MTSLSALVASSLAGDQPTTGEVRHARIFVAVMGASSLLCAEATWTHLNENTPTVLAVLPFDNRGEATNVAGTIADILPTSLANLDYLTLVERLRIDALLKEFDLQDKGITEADGLAIGKMINADDVLLGSINALGSTSVFTVRMLDVETGEVTSGRQVACEECRSSDLFDAIRLLGSTIAK